FATAPQVASNGTLTFTTAPDANGSAQVTVRLRDNGGAAAGIDTSAPQTFSITVTPVNDPPRFTKGANQTVLEDAGAQVVTGWATAISAGGADESGQLLTFVVANANESVLEDAGPQVVPAWATAVSAGAPDEAGQAVNFIVTNTNDALFAVRPAIAADGTLTYTPAPNANGSSTVTVRLHDNGGTTAGVDTSAAETFTIAVVAVNDAPSFTKGADQSIAEDGGPQSVASWATGISMGPADESGQRGTFSVTANTNAALFAAAPAVDASGTLTYTPAANANGSATITLRLTDDGGAANGGVNASAAQSFVIAVAARNDAPSFTRGADQSVPEDAGPQSIAWATNISAGASDEAAQALDFIVASSNAPLFSAQPAISSTGTLTYTPAPNANGSATVTVRLHDNGGTAGGGVDTSAPQTFTITITPVNDAPVAFADQAATTQGVAVIIPVLANDTDVDGSTLTVTGVSASAGATVGVNADGTVTYRPAADFLGSDTFTYRAADGPGSLSAPATVTVVVGLKTVTAAAAPNVAVATGTSAVPADPIQTSVTSPVAATVSMTSGVVSESNPPADFVLLNQQVNITVASNGTEVVASLANPLRVTFTLDASAIPANETIASIQILRNDQVLTACAGATAIPAGPDPCISGRVACGGGGAGDFQFTVLATHASRWNFGLKRVLTKPQAVNDRYTVAGGATLTVGAPGVLANDLAKNPMTAVLVNGPSSGVFSLNANGSFAFTPAAG